VDNHLIYMKRKRQYLSDERQLVTV